MDINRDIQRAMDIGRANQEVLELARNWCAHLAVEIPPWSGVGWVEQATGLPIGMRHIRCQYARAAGIAGMDLKAVALDFYDRNCVGCKERLPVRLPNLLQLVEERDRELQRQEQHAQDAVQERARQVEERAYRRHIRREGGDRARGGIFDILDRLDRAPTEADHRILLETARAAADKFDAAVQEALFELAEAGGWTRTEAALEALDMVTTDRSKLTEAALKALARGDALHTAGSIVGKWLDASHRSLLLAAMPALIYLASPRRGLHGESGFPGDPEPLLAVYRLLPDIVYAGIREGLRDPYKRSRIESCNVTSAIIEEAPDFALRVAGDLIGSLGLPDDHYDEGSAEDTVATTLAEALKSRPAEIDAIVQHALITASDAERVALFRVYTHLLRPQWYTPQVSLTPGHELAFSRIVEVLTQRPADGRFEEAAYFVRDHVEDYPRLLAKHAETLLGAAALIASDLDNPYSPLLDPRPNTMKTIDAETRQMHLDTALQAVAQAVGWAAQRQPHSVGRQVVQTLEHLGEGYDRLKAALVRCLGIMGENREGLAVALPAFYTAMMDRSQRVRAEAARAYGELAESASEDLPSLVHESFLVLLVDPYVIVHRAAINALRRVRLPQRFISDAIARLMMLIVTYTSSRGEDEFLSECLDRLMSLCGQIDALSPEIIQMIITMVDRMEPQVTARFIRYHRWRLRGTPGFPDLVVKLLADPNTYDRDLEELAEELVEVSFEDIRRLGHAIRDASAACARRGVDLTDNFLDVLTSADVWSEAVAVAQAATNRLEDALWNRPRKLHAKARQAAAELELATASGQTAQILTGCAKWREILQEIQRDYEENEAARSPLRGIQLPRPSE